MGDNIMRPDHYCDGRKYEPKDVIRDWGLNFNLGSAVKYISRAGRKGDKLEDLRKARQFLEFEIEAEEENRLLASLSGHSYDVTRQEISEALAKKSDIGTTCKEAAEIGNALVKGFMAGLNMEEEENSELEIEKEHKTCIYVNGLLSRFIDFNSIPDEYKPRVIDKIARKVLNSGCDIENDISSDELREAVIGRIVERIINGELSSVDIPWRLFEYSRRIRNAVNLKYRDDPPFTVKDTIEITFSIGKD